MRIFIASILVWSTVVISSAHAEVVSERWCDQMIPSNIKFTAALTIVAADDGKTYLSSKYGDGSNAKIEFFELGNEIYQARNSNQAINIGSSKRLGNFNA